MTDHTPDIYWKSYESHSPIENIEGLVQFVQSVASASSSVVWRGVADHRWSLHSRLYRQALASSSRPLTENQLQAIERDVLQTARQWGIDRVPSGLSGLELLAKLQHTGSPTRLIDVSHNPLVAAWFAARDSQTNPATASGKDGRLFAIDYSGLELADDLGTEPPWLVTGSDLEAAFQGEGVWVWTPPPVDQRMAAQSGAFLVGPVPSTRSGGKWYNANDTTYPSGTATGRYTVAEVRQLTSVSIRAYRTMRRATRYRRNPVVSVRIAARCKSALRRDLASVFNLRPELLFPDAFGLASHLTEQVP